MSRWTDGNQSEYWSPREVEQRLLDEEQAETARRIAQRQHPEYDHLVESAQELLEGGRAMPGDPALVASSAQRRYSLEVTRAEAEAIQAWAAATLALPGAPEVAWQVFESLRAVLEEEAPTG